MKGLKHLGVALFGVASFCSCSLHSTRINDGAYLVESIHTQIPIEGAYIEVQYTKNEGGTYDLLASTTTDENGWFQFDELVPDCFDCWERVDIYSDSLQGTLLGSFEYVHSDPDNIFAPHIIHVDTFSLEHTVFGVPRIDSLPSGSFSNIQYSVGSFPLASGVASDYTVAGPVQVGDRFEAIELVMSFQTQHWVRFGYGEIARARMQNQQNQDVGGGFFWNAKGQYTAQGDTIYLDFIPD